MRKRFHHFRVCSCSPKEGVVYLEAQMLRTIVNKTIHPIRCASTCGRKALKGLYLGDLCAEAHHPSWAMSVWSFTIGEIHDKDYDDWVGVWFNPKYVQLRDVISNGLCEILGKRMDDLNRRLGRDEPDWRYSNEYCAGDFWYDSFSYEKYDYDWNGIREEYVTLRREAKVRQRTERMFREGQGELPPQAQDFFYYWADFDPTTQDLNFKIDDWDFEAEEEEALSKL